MDQENNKTLEELLKEKTVDELLDELGWHKIRDDEKIVVYERYSSETGVKFVLDKEEVGQFTFVNRKLGEFRFHSDDFALICKKIQELCRNKLNKE